MRIFIILIALIGFLNSEEIEVQADDFSADEAKKVAILNGHVKIIKNGGWIKADKLIIDFNKKRKPIRYTATGHVKFDVKVKKSRYKGKSKEIIYEPQKKRYIFNDDVYLEDMTLKRKIFANRVFVDELSGKSKIE